MIPSVSRTWSSTSDTSVSYRGRTDTPQYVDHRRNVHTNAEQRRRGSLKNGFEQMRSLIPSLRRDSGMKVSKAALLHKGGDYLQQLKREREHLSHETAKLRRDVDGINRDLAECHNSLSSSLGSASSQAASQERLQALFDAHVRERTMADHKYWIFSLLMQPLMLSFSSAVGVPENMEDMEQTTRSWVNQHLRLVHLRPLMLNSLKEISIATDILERPDLLQQEAVRAVTEPRREARPQQSPQAAAAAAEGEQDEELADDDSDGGFRD